ncbi:trophoblast glycoprotein b [Rhincodon typus]|uniref:trophoblast glycoprotein b n=1 Tax=Rhincodon typus TaxID=259920 RepID=UPI002030D46F|nr:trophoblast glycoprotein b [Rhincodon typus]
MSVSGYQGGSARPGSLSPLGLGIKLSLVLLSYLQPAAPSVRCPLPCDCSEAPETVKCVNGELSGVPSGIPDGVRTLLITGNDIPSLTSGAFEPALVQLVNLSLRANRIGELGGGVFASLPRLRQLDLSDNRLLSLSPAAFGSAPAPLRELNLSRALGDPSAAEQVAALLRTAQLPELRSLQLTDNRLSYLPAGAFSGLASLRHLELADNSLSELGEDAFGSLQLETLDLRSNALRTLTNSTVTELRRHPFLRLRLAGNPFACDCHLEPLLAWLQLSRPGLVDTEGLVCASPESLTDRPLLQLRPAELKCPVQGDMESVLQTSYVFLGIVLALIGVIFMFVLYLNRKGIKKWLYNVRDACRDHMEGYHYRYEINSDPRLTNLSSNSEA